MTKYYLRYRGEVRTFPSMERMFLALQRLLAMDEIDGRERPDDVAWTTDDDEAQEAEGECSA